MIDHPLHAVALYNPAFQSREELIRFFIARQAELARLLDAIRREGPNPPQHHLIVGARGMGKTTLIHRLRFAIADDPDLSKCWLGLTFPEEQYNVGALSDFWLNCVDALADTLESAGRSLPDLDAQVAKVSGLAREEDRRRQALDLLRRSADHLGRRLVLLVDNIDLILDRFKDDGWALREVLSNEPRLLLIGATAAPLEAQHQYGKAFYDFFRVLALQGIGREETFTVLRALAEATKQPHVAKVVDEQPGRIETLRLFAGGNPRTLTLLFNLLAQGTEGDVRADLERLLDLYTPLYKARFERLAPQTQRVVDALALHHHPATAHQIAEATRLDVKAVSTHLDRLRKDGLVEAVDLPGERRMGFQIAERFFNIWYLMRTSRRVRTRLLWLVEFLRLMYGPEELVHDQALHHGLETASLQDLAANPDLRGRLGALLDLDGVDAPKRDRVGEAWRLSPGDPGTAHTFATIEAALGRWAEEAVRAFLIAGDEYLQSIWPDVLRFFAEVVRHGLVDEARRVLRELGLGERYEPLDRALEIAAAGDAAKLGRLAPEVRQAVELVLARIASHLIPSPSRTG